VPERPEQAVGTDAIARDHCQPVGKISRVRLALYGQRLVMLHDADRQRLGQVVLLHIEFQNRPDPPSDFVKLRRPGLFFVDKSELILRILTDSYETMLFPSPRRFGKSTNLSMLGYFLGKSDKDHSALFQTWPSGVLKRPGDTSSATRWSA
jgi:hypothetical protein